MARSLAECAADRHARRAADVREALARGDAPAALWIALKGIMSEAKKLLMRRNADGLLTMADAAGTLLAYASGLYEHRPAMPRGCPPAPRPEDLLRMFDRGLSPGPAQGPS